MNSPHFSPSFVARAARFCVQWGFRPEGRAVVLDCRDLALRPIGGYAEGVSSEGTSVGSSSIPMRENTAGHGASQVAAGSW